MNTIETERLVRRIVATLKGEGDPAMAPKLAADFQTACSSAALRLEQCRSMIDAGASVQAIQMAETQPNLLDLVTVLEFRQADDWRQYCRTKNLPCPETLPARDVAAFNNCYNLGISPQHPVYAAYREAVLGRKDDEALMALKSIVRLNPKDTNAASELARLDAKMLGIRLAKLATLLNSDPNAALQELDQIEGFGFKSELSGEVWRRGQLARSGHILADAEQLMQQNLLAETVAQLDFLTQLRSEHSLVWTSNWENRIAALQIWCRTEDAARQRVEEFHGALDQVGQIILLSEGKDTRSKKVSLLELKSDWEEMHRRYRRVESFLQPVPDDLVQRFKKRSAFLQQKIKRKTRIRTLVISSAAAGFILLISLMTLAFLGLRRANSLASELKKATAANQVRTVESLLKQTTGKLILPTPKLKSISASAASAVTGQMALLAEFEADFKKLPPLNTVVTLKQFIDVNECLNLVKSAHQALAPDLQAETQPALNDFAARWSIHCDEQLAMLNQELDNQLSGIESSAAQLNETQELPPFRTSISELLPKLEQVSQQITVLAPCLKLRPELGNRCQELQERLRKDQSAIARLDAALAALARADKAEEVAAAVADLATIDIKQSDYARAARKAGAVIALKEDPDALSRGLLTGTNATLWESFTKVGKLDLTPTKTSYEVRQRFMELARDYAVNSTHFRCRLHHDPQSANYEEWITDGPLMNDNSWHTTHAWTVQDQGPCEFGLKNYGAFSGQYKFSNNENAYGVTVTDITRLTDVWQSSGFATLVDTRSMTWKQPPLKVADGIIAAKDASPLMRAFLLKELIGFMAAQPLESGLAFAPELQKLPEKLRALDTDQISSGDWFVPSRVNALEPKLAHFFAAYQGISFFKQANGLLNATTQATKSGFALAGYAGPDGLPVWKSAPGDNFFWGLPEQGNLPALLFIVHDNQTRMVAKPLPLTPLLTYQGDLAAIIKDSGVGTVDPSFKAQLPPLFTAPVTTP